LSRHIAQYLWRSSPRISFQSALHGPAILTPSKGFVNFFILASEKLDNRKPVFVPETNI
jgi:hypothetical protein